jgi:hypothetical protein
VNDHSTCIISLALRVGDDVKMTMKASNGHVFFFTTHTILYQTTRALFHKYFFYVNMLGVIVVLTFG